MKRLVKSVVDVPPLRCDPIPMILAGPLRLSSLRPRSGLDYGWATNARRTTEVAIVFRDLDMGVVKLPNLPEQC